MKSNIINWKSAVHPVWIKVHFRFWPEQSKFDKHIVLPGTGNSDKLIRWEYSGKPRASSKNTVKADTVNNGSIIVCRKGFLFCFFSLVLFEKRKEWRALGAKRGPKVYRLFLQIILTWSKTDGRQLFWPLFWHQKSVDANPYLGSL